MSNLFSLTFLFFFLLSSQKQGFVFVYYEVNGK